MIKKRADEFFANVLRKGKNKTEENQESVPNENVTLAILNPWRCKITIKCGRQEVSRVR